MMWLWIAAATAAFFVKGLCGFANTLVFTSILGFGANNVDISPVDLLLGYPTNMILTWKNRRDLDRKVVIPLSLLVLAGSIPGAFILKNASSGAVKIIFGAVVILLGAEMLLREEGILDIESSKAVLGVIGVLSGVLCGLFGVGALLAAYVGRTTETSDGFKANISAVFIVENTFRIILYSAIGVITPAAVKQALMLVPFMLAGLFAGIKCSSALDEKTVRRAVMLLLIVSGAVLIIRNL